MVYCPAKHKAMKKRAIKTKLYKEMKILTDPFYKSEAAVKKIDDLKIKRLFWKDKNLDAD